MIVVWCRVKVTLGEHPVGHIVMVVGIRYAGKWAWSNKDIDALPRVVRTEAASRAVSAAEYMGYGP